MSDPDGGAWSQSNITDSTARGAGILEQRVLRRQAGLKQDPYTGKRISRLNPAPDHVVSDVPDLRIVPQQLWEAVHARRAQQKRATRPDAGERPFWAQRRPRHLFSGEMRCGAREGAYTKVGANLFGCASARNNGTCDDRLNIRPEVLEVAVVDGFRNHLLDPDLFKVFAAEFHAEVNRLRMDEGADRAAADAELQRIE